MRTAVETLTKPCPHSVCSDGGNFPDSNRKGFYLNRYCNNYTYDSYILWLLFILAMHWLNASLQRWCRHHRSEHQALPPWRQCTGCQSYPQRHYQYTAKKWPEQLFALLICSFLNIKYCMLRIISLSWNKSGILSLWHYEVGMYVCTCGWCYLLLTRETRVCWKLSVSSDCPVVSTSTSENDERRASLYKHLSASVIDDWSTLKYNVRDMEL